MTHTPRATPLTLSDVKTGGEKASQRLSEQRATGSVDARGGRKRKTNLAFSLMAVGSKRALNCKAVTNV